MVNETLDKEKINKLIEIFRKGDFHKALEICNYLLNKLGDEPFLYNLKGMTEIKLNEFDNSLNSFKRAIDINSNFVEAYNNLATSYINLGQFEKAINCLENAIKIKPHYSNAFNNLASAQSDLGKYDDALVSFNKILNLEPNYPRVKENIIKILTYFNPNNSNLNEYTRLNSDLKSINIDGDLSDANIIKFYKTCNETISNKLDNLEFNFSQTWRRNKIDLNCNRHFDVFRNFNVIPEFCFGCFKIQIELVSVLDLFKLYFIFDNLDLKDNRSRKCLIEMRSFGNGNYKGIIYCDGYEEAKLIYKKINTISKNILQKKTIFKVKRGCTEFGKSYPDYKNINKKPQDFMKYDNDWKKKENIIDRKLPIKNRINQRIISETIKGVSLNDFLIMKNWIMYAKIIDDLSYKKLDENIKISRYIKNELSNQLSFRKDEFKKLVV